MSNEEARRDLREHAENTRRAIEEIRKAKQGCKLYYIFYSD